MNIHAPERQANETQSAYRERRLASKRAAQQMTLRGPFAPGKTSSREQHRDALRSNGRMHKVAGAYGRGLRNWANRKAAAEHAARAAA